MKVQFKALRVFTFFLGVVIGSNDAFTSAQYQDFQDRRIPVLGKVPYRVRCNVGYHGTLDNPVPYPTRCTIGPYGAGSSYYVNSPASAFGAHNFDAANTPYNAEYQSPDFPQVPSISFFTRDPTPPYLIGKPAEDQKLQTTFSFRQAESNQEGPRLLFSEFPPFQRTKRSWRRSDQSDYSSPANRNQHFLNKNFPSEAAIKSDLSRRHKLMHSISVSKDPNHSVGDSVYKQHTNIRQYSPRESELTKSQLYSSASSRHSLTSPSSETPDSSFSKDLVDGYPSSPSFSEEQEDAFFSQDPSSSYFSEEQEDLSSPYFSEEQEDSSSPYFSEEEEDSSFPQDPSSSYFSEEQEEPSFPQDPSSSYFSDEQEDPSFSEEQEVPSYSSFSEERRPSSFSRHFSSSSFSDEQRSSLPRYASSLFLPQEQRASSFPHYPRYRHYPQYAESPAVNVIVSEDIPLTKPLPSNQEHDPLAEVLELLKLRRINERPSWYNEEPSDRKLAWGNKHKDDEDVWSPPVRRRRNSFLSRIQRKLKRIFHFPRRVQLRND